MNKRLQTIGLVLIVVLAGCSGAPAADGPDADNGTSIENDTAGATDVTQSLGITVDETTTGDELNEIGATYPRDEFVVDAAQHDEIEIGVDSDGDGTTERTFNETHISGVNNNAYSFDISLESGYTLQSGDVVTVEYPAIDNPSEPGEYTVELRLNDRQTANATAVIE
ncbi:hypothetical protein [Halohasta litorea]|uniref:DUF4625 domain-containing protein n=1 Tax=Halohasta litorea TaxID=869891 RepID=A0ABD6D9A9_9EURY|nr:hypothetical protein [Halohasta litorea]